MPPLRLPDCPIREPTGRCTANRRDLVAHDTGRSDPGVPVRGRTTTAMRRSRGLRRASDKRLALLGQRIEMLALADRSACAGAELVPEVACEGPIDPHEPLTRARGGSIVDPANVVFLCRRHHGWVHGNPEKAHALGLLRHSWERT